MSIPVSAQELTPEWLTWALRQGGRLADGQVTSASPEEIGVGKGFASQLYRVKVEYSGNAESLPASFIAKLPPVLEFVRELLAAFGLDRREVHFYQELAGPSPLRVPICDWSALHPEVGYGALLLEDLHDAQVLDQIESCSLELAQQAVEDLAGFHARWWDDPKPMGSEWLIGNMEERYQAVAALYGERSQLFAKRNREWLPSKFRDAMGSIARLVGTLARRAAEPGSTLVHGDFRLDNLILEQVDGTARICFIDFQLLNWGSGAYDLAYFMGQSLKTKARREHQELLLDAYHDKLLAGGVEGFSRTQLGADYREALLAATIIPVMLSQTLSDTEETAKGEGEEAEAGAAQLPGLRRLFSTMSRRSVDAVLDNDALGLLDD